ncbi:YjdJ family protein [Halobacillus sp. Marseille-P3879]|uniref:YjdJ family protein n=1 Tax=Halobacillus sp. Marseille-P3879 TaxID=2045014 RepID=UPI000C7A8FCF|nr:YjdJ family protein [Halobacillus sp. Marseille-P3879]
MYKFLTQIGISFFLLIFAAFASWYEGSAILENPWEWKYSTPFSELFYGEVHSQAHISQLDYFVYAAKFQPAFPILMVVSSIYIILLIGNSLFRDRLKTLTLYLCFWGASFISLSLLINHSPTTGGKIFTFIFLISGIWCCAKAAYVSYKTRGKLSHHIVH